MTPEEKAQLDNLYTLVKENNEILRSIRRSTRFTLIMRIAYWVVIIAVSFGALYFIQPYFDFLRGAAGENKAPINTDQGYAAQIRDLLK